MGSALTILIMPPQKFIRRKPMLTIGFLNADGA